MVKILTDDLLCSVNGGDFQLGNSINTYDASENVIKQNLNLVPAAPAATGDTGIFSLEHAVPGLAKKL